MNGYYTIFYITSAIIGGFLIVKTYFFLARSQFQNPGEWFYFSRYSIYTTRGEQLIKARRAQNTLSLIILFLAILDLFFLLMMNIA
ncbi:hypothetical protein [Parafilimonas sp.]|uniref:hypothetical protein n=1 Tax=Parafilimonas sp. TaxID=1969739 RepID=UPI0039E24108